MTPTLNGRWQTRIAMLATIGLLITALFAWNYDDSTFFKVLLYVGIFGVVWDVGFIALQQLRWDRDWPPVFQVLAGVAEGVLVYVLIDNLGLPGIEEGVVPLDRFIAHYGLVWLAIFIWVQGPMRAIFPFWRFNGGRII